MSTKLKQIATLCCLFFVGFGSSWLLSQVERSNTSENNERMMASVKQSASHQLEKHLMPLVLTVQGPDQYPNNPEATVVLKATIRTPFAEFSNINYKWILPDEVEVVKGHTVSDIQNPEPNKVYTAEITVKGFNSLERKEISLVATTIDSSGTHLGNSAVITSRPEDSMEHIAPVMMVKAQEFKASQDKERMPASKDEQ